MQTMYDNTRRVFAFKNYTGDFGIEIETESKTKYDYPMMKFWDAKGDGSLRNFGVEYVLKQPVSYGAELQAALSEFKEKTKSFKFVEDSVSTSVHVHVNFLQQKFLTMANFLATYTILENLLCRFSGPERASNLFCLPIADAEDSIDSYTKVLKAIDSRKFRNIVVPPNTNKYAALNICNLSKLGTLEIRTFRGTSDIKEIMEWVSIIKAILDFAKIDKITPAMVLDIWKENPDNFLIRVLGDQLASKLDYPDKLKLMSRNLWYASRLAICSPKWEEFGELKARKYTKAAYASALSSLAKGIYGKEFNNLSAVETIIVEEEFTRSLAEKNVVAVFADGDE